MNQPTLRRSPTPRQSTPPHPSNALAVWSLVMVLLAAAVTSSVSAQTVEADPQAPKAFEDMVKAWRNAPGLTVKSTVKVEVMDGDVAAQSSEVKGEFTFGRNQNAIIKLRGYTCYLHTEQGKSEGVMSAVHEGNATSYFTTTDDGSPYYALFNSFTDLPFPELAIMLGFDATEDILMQFHQKEPFLQPTAVSMENVDGKAIKRLTLAADHSKMNLHIDPDTNLMLSATLEITGGPLVQTGATLVYHYEWAYDVHDDPPDASMFVLDPGERQKIDLMAALAPRAAARGADDDENGGGGGGGGGRGSLIGQPAPPITLATADGKAFDLQDAQGRVVVLDFWASWCGPCMVGLPELHKVASWAADEQLPVTIMTVNCWEIRTRDTDTPDNRLASARKTWETKGFTLPIAMDYADQIGEAYRVRGIPTTVIIRSDGVVHAIHEGVAETEALKSDILAALKAVEPGL